MAPINNLLQFICPIADRHQY